MLCTFLGRGLLTSAAARGGGGHCWWRQLVRAELRPANARAATARVLDDGSRSPPPLESSESGQLHRTTSELAQKKQFLEGVGLRPRPEAAVLQAPSKDALVLNAVREMAPYLSVHAGATMVVHIPGGLVASESLGQFLDDVSLLHMLGISKRGRTVVLPVTSWPLSCCHSPKGRIKCKNGVPCINERGGAERRDCSRLGIKLVLVAGSAQQINARLAARGARPGRGRRRRCFASPGVLPFYVGDPYK